MLRLGQIGAGLWGSNLLRNFNLIDNAKMVVVCDKDARKLEKAKSLYSSIETTTSPEEFFKRQDIDAVIIATPPSAHGALAEEALKRKKHVFVEKPIALTTADARNLLELSESSKLTLMVGHLLLYHPAVIYLKKIIEAGTLGDIFYLYSTRVNLGQVRLEENALWSLAPHDVSVALYLAGEMPIEITARGESYLQKDIEDIIFMTLRFSNNILANIHVSWLDPHKIRKFTIVGSKKMAVFDDMEKQNKIKIYDKGAEIKLDYNYGSFFNLRDGDVETPALNMAEPLKLECQHFVNSVLNKTRPFTDGKNGLEVLSVLEAANESLKNLGKPVKVKRILK